MLQSTWCSSFNEISPFNKQANRLTSFASMHVVPFFEEMLTKLILKKQNRLILIDLQALVANTLM